MIQDDILYYKKYYIYIYRSFTCVFEVGSRKGEKLRDMQVGGV